MMLALHDKYGSSYASPHQGNICHDGWANITGESASVFTLDVPCVSVGGGGGGGVNVQSRAGLFGCSRDFFIYFFLSAASNEQLVIKSPSRPRRLPAVCDCASKFQHVGPHV